MKLIKVTQNGGVDFYAIKSVAVQPDGHAVVLIGEWDDASRAETLTQPLREWSISIHFEAWSESSMGEIFPLVASLPEFQGATLVETIPEPMPPEVWVAQPTDVFDVGSAPV